MGEGVYEVTGTLMSDEVTIYFSNLNSDSRRVSTYPCPGNPSARTCGGVDPESLQIIEGPNPRQGRNPCSMHFNVYGSSRPLPQTFRFQLAVRGSIATIC